MHLNVWNGEKEDYTKAKLIFVFLVTLYMKNWMINMFSYQAWLRIKLF